MVECFENCGVCVRHSIPLHSLQLHVVMHDNPSMICARGAVLLDGELGRGRLTAALSFSIATAWGHLSWLV